MVSTVLEESVKKRAYELFQKRGSKPGNEQEDWYQAEKEILNQMNNTNPLSQQQGKSNGKKRQPVAARTY